MKLDALHSNQYKNILMNYKQLLQSIENMVGQEIKPERIEREHASQFKEILDKTKDFQRVSEQERQNKQAIIRKRYKNTKKEYENPQLELLRRQDFDAELATLTKGEIADILSDTERDFTEYELRTIIQKYPNKKGADTNAISLAKQRLQLIQDKYIFDPEYEELVEELQYLKLLSVGLVLFDNTEKGYEILNPVYKEFFLTQKRNGYLTGNLQEYIKKLTLAISLIKPKQGITKEFTTFEDIAKKESQYEIKEGDTRVFRESPDYDTVIRFKYLRERFNSGDNRFDFRRDDYDPMSHFTWLEQQHKTKLEQDTAYHNAYSVLKQKALQEAK